MKRSDLLNIRGRKAVNLSEKAAVILGGETQVKTKDRLFQDIMKLTIILPKRFAKTLEQSQ